MFKNSLEFACEKVRVEIQAFVLMSNHYHLLLWTPNTDLDRFMYFLNKKFSELIRAKTGRINRIFGDRYHWSVVKDNQHHKIVLKYIYQNPIRASLANKCELYKFSSLYYFVKQKQLKVNLYTPIYGDLSNFLNWINNKEYFPESFSRAIRKPIFKYPKHRTCRRLIN